MKAPKTELIPHYALIVIHKCAGFVIPAGKRVSSAMDGKLKYIHVSWIPAIPTGMTSLNTLVYNDGRWSLGTRQAEAC